jgi:hypothetical protein
MWDDIDHDLLLYYNEEACKKARAESNKKYRASKRQRISNDDPLRIITNQENNLSSGCINFDSNKNIECNELEWEREQQ